MQWLPDGHLAYFVLDLVRELEVSAIEGAIQSKDPRGVRPYSPRMMTALLLYAYCGCRRPPPQDARGFRRFSLRGLAKAGVEWAIVCLCHNLLKLYRAAPRLVHA